MPREYEEWAITKRTGWTFEYIRSLGVQDYNNILQMIDAEIKAGMR